MVEKVFRSVMGEDAWQKHLGCEQNYEEDCAKFEAMTNKQLAEATQRYLNHCQRPEWPQGTPVYDAVMWHNLIPEMIRRLRD